MLCIIYPIIQNVGIFQNEKVHLDINFFRKSPLFFIDFFQFNKLFKWK